MRFEALIFDVDGTVADTLPVCVKAFQVAVKAHEGRDIGVEEIEAQFGPSEEGMLQQLAPSAPKKALATYLREYEQAHQSCTSAFPGITQLLDAAKQRGCRLGVVTGKGPVSAKITCDVLGLSRYFESVEAGSPDGSIKVQSIAKLLALWGLVPSKVAYIGDAPSDIDAARSAGVASIAACWAPGADRLSLAEKSPDALFDEVRGLQAWLLGSE